MQSKWFKLKPVAISLRKKGCSMSKIENLLGIPRSTLSGWLRNIKLSQKQKEKLSQNSKKGLAEARIKAVLWHNAQKEHRIQDAKSQAIETLKQIDLTDKSIIEIALSMLYLGEGSKINEETSMGSSNPLILKFFLSCLVAIYNFDIKKAKFQLSLRADQNVNKMKRFWSKELGIPIENFIYAGIDKRTIGSKTFSGYKGVCNVRCGNVAIQRKLIFTSEIFCETIIKKY